MGIEAPLPSNEFTAHLIMLGRELMVNCSQISCLFNEYSHLKVTWKLHMRGDKH